jgi:hypothetical protein
MSGPWQADRKANGQKKLLAVAKKPNFFPEQREELAGNAGPYPVASGDKEKEATSP